MTGCDWKDNETFDGVIMMSDPSKILSLISLLDDESPEIQERVRRELNAFGPSLYSWFEENRFPLNETQAIAFRSILFEFRDVWFSNRFPECLKQGTFHERLEAGFSIISGFFEPLRHPDTLKLRLDQLANEYTSYFVQKSPLKLSRFLFEEKGFSGDKNTYYSPANNDLLTVLNSGRGIPLTLTSLLILVGQRLGIEIHGSNLPGHFLALVEGPGELFFIDCFDGGNTLSLEEVYDRFENQVPEPVLSVLVKPCSVETILKRCLKNLEQSFQLQGKPSISETFRRTARKISTVHDLV